MAHVRLFSESTVEAPQQTAIHFRACKQLIPEGVAANRQNKLKGSFGRTLVMFLEGESGVHGVLRKLQRRLVDCLGDAIPDIEQGCFQDHTGHAALDTAFVPVENLHTTLCAMRVVDVNDEQGWNDQLLRINQLALQAQSRPKALATFGDKVIFPELLRKSIVDIVSKNKIHLMPISFSLNPNGSVSLVWKADSSLSLLRNELAKLGGVAKHGNDIITTTIGYFPNCRPECLDHINNVLANEIDAIGTELALCSGQSEKGLELDPMQARLVTFSRNDLASDVIFSTPFIEEGDITHIFDHSEFPSQLSHVSHEKTSLSLKYM